MKRAIILVYLALMPMLNAVEWIAKWDANTEPDLAGYVLAIDSDGEVWTVDVKNTTSYTFIAGDSVCAWAYAYDQSMNVSEPSETVCEKVVPVNPFDLNGDGVVDVSDKVYWQMRFWENPNDPQLDLTGDGTVDVSDKVYLQIKINERTF